MENIRKRREGQSIRRTKRLHDYYVRLERRRRLGFAKRPITDNEFKKTVKTLRKNNQMRLWVRIKEFIINLVKGKPKMQDEEQTGTAEGAETPADADKEAKSDGEDSAA